MNSDVWIGAATTLSGALLAGVISLALSRQQMKDAREQRLEQTRVDIHQRSIERRFTAYADFYTRVRVFRNALRTGDRPAPQLAMDDISALARAAHDASSLVFLTAENRDTRTACADLVRAMSETQGILDDRSTAPAAKPWAEINERISLAIRHFETSARRELGVTATDSEAETGRRN